MIPRPRAAALCTDMERRRNSISPCPVAKILWCTLPRPSRGFGRHRFLVYSIAVLRMSFPLNTLCYLPYDYQFLMHFPPILDDLHSNVSGGGRTCPRISLGNSRLRVCFSPLTLKSAPRARAGAKTSNLYPSFVELSGKIIDELEQRLFVQLKKPMCMMSVWIGFRLDMPPGNAWSKDSGSSAHV